MLFVLLAFFVVLCACQTGDTLSDVLSKNNDTLSSLSGLLKTQPDLVAALSEQSDITILAPTNDAISKLDDAAMKMVASDPGFVKALLQYHVINGTVKAADISDKPTFAHTLLQNQTFANVTNGQVVEAISEGDKVTFKTSFGATSNVTKAVRIDKPVPQNAPTKLMINRIFHSGEALFILLIPSW